MGQARAVDASAVVVGFARALRAAGVDASPDRVQAFLGALDTLDPGARSDVYWAGRLTLCGSQDDLERYERVFAAYFGGRPGGAPARSAPRRGPGRSCAAPARCPARRRGPRTPYPWPCWPTPPTYCATGTSPS
ncbi:hypothetical protein O1M63_08015 [Streptomyces mirabilis]|nr:hypothetical protein [Streptomyces mirabilis]